MTRTRVEAGLNLDSGGETSNSIAFGKSTSQSIYSKQHTPKIGYKLHKYGLKHALHSLDDHFT